MPLKSEREEPSQTTKHAPPPWWQIALAVVSCLSILIGSTGIADAYVKWDAWLDDGLLTHYRSVKAALFGWLPLSVPDRVQDGFVIFSGLLFWSWRTLLEGAPFFIKGATDFGPGKRIQPFFAKVLVFLVSPVAVLLFMFGPISARWTQRKELWNTSNSVYWSAAKWGLLLVACFLAILFTASDFLDRFGKNA